MGNRQLRSTLTNSSAMLLANLLITLRALDIYIGPVNSKTHSKQVFFMIYLNNMGLDKRSQRALTDSTFKQ